MNRDAVGYYADAYAPFDLPAYDPPMTARCPFCNEPIRRREYARECFAQYPGSARLYFYRAHEDCWERASVEERVSCDHRALVAVEALPPA
jgi:hypothetical protein